MYDVIIVGLGPAGGMTALSIAENSDLNVLAVDRKKEIGVPVSCAGGIIIKMLDKVGLNVPNSCIATKIYGTRIFSPGGNELKIETKDERSYILHRNRFDQWLAGKAMAAGVETRLNTKITGLTKEGVKTKDGEIKGEIIVGADGPISRIGKWAGIDIKMRKVCCIQKTIENEQYDSRYNSAFYDNNLTPGAYAWIFPEGSDKIRVGLGAYCPTHQLSLSNRLEKFFNSHVELCGAENVIETIGGIVPIVKPFRKTAKDNILLVGDAAGHIDPSTGGGIANALRCGKIAGECIAYNKIEEYEKLWKKELGKVLIRRYKLRQVLDKWTNKDIDRAIGALKDFKLKSLDLEKALTGQRASIGRLIWHIFLKDPVILKDIAFGLARRVK